MPIQLTSMVSPLMVASMYELGSLELVCFHVPVRSAGWGLGSSLLVSVFDVPSDLAGASAVVLPPASGQAGKQHRRNKQCDCLFHDGSLFVPDIVVRHDSIIWRNTRTKDSSRCSR